jgi:uncharacterized protein YfiM (DUF2279 family)
LIREAKRGAETQRTTENGDDDREDMMGLTFEQLMGDADGQLASALAGGQDFVRNTPQVGNCWPRTDCST